MTVIDKEFEEVEETTITVAVCDLCGIEETLLPDSEDVKHITIGNKQVEITYRVENEDGGVQRFDEKDEARAHVDRLGGEFRTSSMSTEVTISFGESMDVCDHCINTLLSAYSTDRMDSTAEAVVSGETGLF